MHFSPSPSTNQSKTNVQKSDLILFLYIYFRRSGMLKCLDSKSLSTQSISSGVQSHPSAVNKSRAILSAAMAPSKRRRWSVATARVKRKTRPLGGTRYCCSLLLVTTKAVLPWSFSSTVDGCAIHDDFRRSCFQLTRLSWTEPALSMPVTYSITGPIRVRRPQLVWLRST